MFAKSNLFVFDSNKLANETLENIQTMVEFNCFYNRIIVGEDTTKFEQHNSKRVIEDVVDIHIKDLNELKGSINWNAQVFIVGDMANLEKAWVNLSLCIPKDKVITIVENCIVNLSDGFEEMLKKDSRVKFNYI